MKFDEKYIRQAEIAAEMGLTNRQLARLLDVSTATLQKWIRENERFRSALKEGKSVADAKVVRSLYERATGYSHPEEKVFCSEGEIITHDTTKHYPPDTTAQIFWLKNRRPQDWRDRIEHTGKDGERLAGIVHNTLMVQVDPQEASKVYLDIMKGAPKALPNPRVTDVEDQNEEIHEAAREFL